MQVVVDSLMTSYDVVGSGPVVLMIHGWGDDRRSFEPIANNLKTEYTLVSLDLPGFGKTQKPQNPWGLSDYCDFVAKFMKKIGIDQVYALLGHSNGGAIAIRGLAKDQLFADRLVLLASAGIRDTYTGRKKILRIAAKTAKVATYPLPKKLQARIKKRAYGAVGSELFVAEDMQETFKKIVTDDVREDAAKITIPTLLLYGSDDTATPPEFGEIFHQAIPGSTIRIIHDAGHFVHHDQIDEVTTLVREFL